MSEVKYSAKDIARFESYLDCRAGLFSCWLWTGGLDKDGYGVTWMNRKSERAHRVAWELANKQNVPNGMKVLHTCDNPTCCQPLHLFLGTDKDNMRDKTTKGRQAQGHKIGVSRLTADQVKTIRERYAKGEKQSQIAREYGVTQSAIYYIVRGKVWRSTD